MGSLHSRTTSGFAAGCLLNEIARELDRTIEVSSNGKGSISQARTFAANRALVTVIKDYRAQVALRNNHQGYVPIGTSGLRIREDRTHTVGTFWT